MKKEEKKWFLNGELMGIEARLAQCRNLGNVPTNLAIGHNLKRISAALETPRKQMEADDEMKYFLDMRPFEAKAKKFDEKLYERGAELHVGENIVEITKDSYDSEAIAHYREYQRFYDQTKNFDETKYAAGMKKIEEISQEPNKDFAPYLFNLDKLSDDLGNKQSNAALAEVLIAFGQG